MRCDILRIAIAVICIGLTFGLAEVRCSGLKKVKLQNEFFHSFVNALISNNVHEMLPYHTVFNNVYSSFFGCTLFLNNSDEVGRFIADKLSDADSFDQISTLLNEFTVSGTEQIADVEAKITYLTEKSLNSANKRYEQYGKISYLLYPAVTLIAIIVLI